MIMKTKLQALLDEQKELTSKIQRLLNNINYIEFNPDAIDKVDTTDPKKVYIKGHPTRGAEVIKMLEDLGGIDKRWCTGYADDLVYFINYKRDGCIDCLDIEDFRNITRDYTELHLPEEVRTPQDIKVGDWIWVDSFGCDKTYDSDFVYISSNNPHQITKIDGDGDIYFNISKDSMFISPRQGDKFHKVDPPKEEIELIEGEVYVWLNCAVMIYLKNDRSICYDFDHVSGIYTTIESTIRKNISEYIPATQKNIDYIFDVIEKAGKHFDKKNMRLLDVEEWSCERGSPFIRRIGEDIWKCDIFWQKSNNGDVYAENGNIHKVAIPYNDQTKHLINTNKIPDKHYKFVDKL